MTKLPKQWKHWCGRMNLRPYKGSRRYYGVPKWVYLKGRGRHWRINDKGEFQASEVYETFDRWANSVQCAWTVIPKTFDEFRLMVLAMENIQD
jgi:hypothetical protein